MPHSTVNSVRRLAAAGIAGALLSAICGAVVQLSVQPSTTASSDLWRYPWSSDGWFVSVSLLYAALHLLVIAGLVGLLRSGMVGTTRAATTGVLVAIAGTALLFVGELASLPIRNDRTDDTGAIVVGAVFGIAVVLSAIGFLIAGRETMRAGTWQDWRRYTPLAAGLWTTALIGISLTRALPVGVAVYSLCLLALFFALYTRPVPTTVRAARSSQVQPA